jgi:inhibitor of cysteine peptidase
MKKIVTAGMLLTLTALMFSCSSKPYTLKDTGQIERLAIDSVFSVSLEGNPTTGYVWTNVTTENTCLEQLNKGKEYTPAESSNNKVGSGGTYLFTYKVKNTGEAKLKIVYSRPWETNTPPAKIFYMKIFAGTMGTIEGN